MVFPFFVLYRGLKTGKMVLPVFCHQFLAAVVSYDQIDNLDEFSKKIFD